jgi:REP element-mobilizing transposase RayT
MGDMLRGFHVILSTYGFWLPNDPRGSWSDWIRNWELLRFGGATKVDTRQSVAGVQHDKALRLMAKKSLAFPEVFFTGKQAQAIGLGFRDVVEETGYQIYACSIMPQHVHLVIGPSARSIARIVGHLKGRATQKLNELNLHPLAKYTQADGTVPSPWGRNCWKVFIYTEQHLREAIQYVQDNPLKEGKRRQSWSFVTKPAVRRPR